MNIDLPRLALAIRTEFHLQSYDVVYVIAAAVTRWNRLIGQWMPTIFSFNDLNGAVLRLRYGQRVTGNARNGDDTE